MLAGRFDFSAGLNIDPFINIVYSMQCSRPAERFLSGGLFLSPMPWTVKNEDRPSSAQKSLMRRMT